MKSTAPTLSRFSKSADANSPAQTKPECKLKELCQIIPGRHVAENDHNRQKRGVPYLTGPSDFGQLQANATRWTQHPEVMCNPLDVLVVVKGAGVANTNFAPDEPACIGRQLMALRARADVADPLYLYFALASVRQHLKKQAKGATVPGLSIEDIENLEVSRRGLPFVVCLALEAGSYLRASP